MDPIVWAWLLLIGGAFLLVLEFFVPSAGIIGGLAALCLVASIIIGFTHSVGTGVVLLLIVLTGVPVLLAIMIKVWPLTPLGRKLFLSPPTQEQVVPYQEEESQLRDLVGQQGKATTKMLPAGIVRIGRRTYDAVTDGEALEPGEKIVVKAVRMKRLVVRRDDELRSAPSIADSADVLTKPIDELGLEPIDLPENE